MPAKRAALYPRVSDKGQEHNSSLGTQEAACRAYAAERGYTVAEEHVYREVHTATELAERPALTRLRAAMARGEFDVLICYDPDRFSRKQIHSAIMQYYCERAGVELAFAMFDYEKSATGQFLLQARIFAAELEHEKIRERTMRGRRARVASGKLPGIGGILYGYDWADATKARLIPNPDTAPIVRDIFARAVRGETLHAIAAALTAAGIPTPKRAKAWAPSTLSGLLANPAYTGEAVAFRTRSHREAGRDVRETLPPEERIPLPAGTIPPLVDRATFDAVQARLRRNKEAAARRQRHPELYLLRGGIARCAYCGKPLHAGFVYPTNHPERRYPAYMAVSKWHRDCAPGQQNFSAPAAALDTAIWRHVTHFRLQPADLMEALDRAMEETSDPHGPELAAAARLVATIERQQANLARALRHIDSDDASAPLLAELHALAGQLAAAAAERDARAAQQADWLASRDRRQHLYNLWLDAGEAALRATGYAERRDILATLGVRVMVYEGGRYDLHTDDFPPESGIVYGTTCDTVHNTRPGRGIVLIRGGTL